MNLLKTVPVLLLFLFVNCNGTQELGHEKKVLFNLMGNYEEVTGISDNPVGVDLPVFVEFAYPGNNATLQTDLDLSITPEDEANVVKFQKGRFLFIPLKEGGLKLQAMKGNQAFDWLDITAHKLDHVLFKPDFILATLVKDNSIEIKEVDYTLGGKAICLGKEDSLTFTVVPYDKSGSAMIGILDIGVKFDPENILEEDITFPAQDGVAANRVILKPQQDKITKDETVSVEAIVSYEDQTFSKKFTIHVKNADSCY